MSIASSFLPRHGEGWSSVPSEIRVGVDLIQLLSSSMYVEPLDLFREYVQNASDSIDAAREDGLTAGTIQVTLDPLSRVVSIRDDGGGLSRQKFVQCMASFGASSKRQEQRRGFRGVGRLAALGYCRELHFRSRGDGERSVSELRWDCHVLRQLLRNDAQTTQIDELFSGAVSFRQIADQGGPCFFEVILHGVIRLGRDDILNEEVVCQYLAEVAPVPFSDSFEQGPVIDAILRQAGQRSDYEIYVNGVGPLVRPHANDILFKGAQSSKVAEVEPIEILAIDGTLAACGWILHHEYLGAIPRSAGVRGLRLRCGNIQIGTDEILAGAFPESRFNNWTVGEVHVIDRRIVPNARRDYFEPSVHLENLFNHMACLGRGLGHRCRLESRRRLSLRKWHQLERKLRDLLDLLCQQVLAAPHHRSLLIEAQNVLSELDRVHRRPVLKEADQKRLQREFCSLEEELASLGTRASDSGVFRRLSKQRRAVYEEVFAHIYACSRDAREAQILIKKILVSLSGAT